MPTALIHNVLSTEITSIPTWIRTIFKGHYDNTLCNGATWMLVLWKILHLVYSKLAHGYFKRVGTKRYICTRLTDSLWYCGFFSLALAYCLVTFDENRMDLFRKTRETSKDHLSTQATLAYMGICTFYLHTALSEGIQNGSWPTFLKFLLLVAVCISSYILRLLDIPFSLSALVATSAISEELTKICHSLLIKDGLLRGLYLSNLVLFTFIHMFVIPFIFLVPLGKIITFDVNDADIFVHFLFLLLWLCSAIYNSVLSKALFHLVYHTKEKVIIDETSPKYGEENRKIVQCTGSVIECSLFPLRTDDAYHLSVLRAQIRERLLEMDAKKKPKSKNMMLIKTLKCMMAMRKKLNQKRKVQNTDSDKTSETEEIATTQSETKVEMKERKVENTEDTTDGFSAVICENLEHDNNTITNEPSIETIHTSDTAFETSQDHKARELVHKDEETTDELDFAKDDRKTEVVNNNVCVQKSNSAESITRFKENPITSKSISDEELAHNKLDTETETVSVIKESKSLDQDNSDDDGKVKEEKSSTVKMSASYKKSSSGVSVVLENDDQSTKE